MKGRRLLPALCALFLSACLYFFENNTGTRIMLLCALILPLIPWERAARAQERREAQRAASSAPEEEDSGGVRAWVPGDPVNRIHWKLSAKRDELLLRERETMRAPEPLRPEPLPAERVKRAWKRALLPVLLLSLLLLGLIPQARLGAGALCNRLFDASERVNAYRYDRFPVPEDQSITLAAVMLTVSLLSLTGYAAAADGWLPALGILGGAAAFQVYFGVAFPAAVNAALPGLFALKWMKPLTRGKALGIAAGVLALALVTAIFLPGVDAATEAASEKARDRLSILAARLTGSFAEMPEGISETRREHDRKLLSGEREAGTEAEYRLVAVEEEQISAPHRIRYLKIILLLLLTAVLVMAPFVPFAWITSRRKKAMEIRKAFQSGDVNEAVRTMFCHIVSWLETMGDAGGNRPLRDWGDTLSGRISPEYAERFRACSELFEKAVYSLHPLVEEDRRPVAELLEETERIMREKADLRQRFRLRYREFLWV